MSRAASTRVASVSRAAPRRARPHTSLPRRQACRRGCEGLPGPSAAAAVVAPARAGRPRLPAVRWSPLPSSPAGSSGAGSSPCASLCGPSRPQAAPPRAATVRLPVRAVCPRSCGPLAAALALPSRPLRRRGLVYRLHHPVAVEHASTAWHACSLAPGKPMACERRAPFRP